jgi:hypothetical protein
MIRRILCAGSLGLVVAFASPSHAGVHINIVPPSFVIESRPHTVVVPGYPHVEYAPEVDYNYFAYGGRYYTYEGGHWFVGADYGGPWTYVQTERVPVYVRNVPSRYYRGGGWQHPHHGNGHGHGHRHHH